MLLAPLRGHDSPGQRLFSSYPFAALCFTSILEILIISISIIIHVSPGLILCFWTKKKKQSQWVAHACNIGIPGSYLLPPFPQGANSCPLLIVLEHQGTKEILQTSNKGACMNWMMCFGMASVSRADEGEMRQRCQTEYSLNSARMSIWL